MSLSVSPATFEATQRCYLAMTLADALASLLVCQASPNAVLELDASGQLIHMTPTGSETGSRNQALGALLWIAVRASGLPLKLFDSSTGFRQKS